MIFCKINLNRPIVKHYIGLAIYNCLNYTDRSMIFQAFQKAFTIVSLLLMTIVVNAQRAEELFQRGNSLSFNEQYEEALVYVNQSLSMDSSLYQRYMFRAGLKAKLGMIESAIEDVNKCIERCKHKLRKYHVSSYYLERAKLQVLKNDRQQAIVDATKCISINLRSWQAYNFRADLLAKEGKLNDAITDLTKSIGIDENQSDSFIARGKLRIEIGDIEGACKDFSKVVEWGFDEFKPWIKNNCR